MCLGIPGKVIDMSKHDELDWMAELGAVPVGEPTAATAGGSAS